MWSLNPMTYLVAGASALALLGGTYTTGYFVGTRNEAERVITKTITTTKTEFRDNVKVETDLSNKISTLQSKNKSLEVQLNALPFYDHTCDVRPADLGVLNTDVSGTSNVPDKPNGQSTTTTPTVSERDLELDDLYARGEYQKLMILHNTLIDQILKK